MFLVFQEEVLLPRVLPATTHLDALLIHIPNVLGWDTTREVSIKMLHLVEIILDNSHVKMLCTFRVKVCCL